LRNWYQNEVDKKIKEVGTRDKVKHNRKNDQLFKEDDDGGRARVTMDAEPVLRGR